MTNHRSPEVSLDPWPKAIDWYDITLASPAENLALDEVLLQDVDRHPERGILRTWEPSTTFVVVGRSNRMDVEVDVPRCQAEGIRLFRRSSGGGAVVVGPGCFAFTLALPLTAELRSLGVSVVTRQVMETVAAPLATTQAPVGVCGVSDLVIGDRKFSGNSERWLRNAFLHHGTILYDFDLSIVGRYLRSPSRQPDYRSGRSHDDFVTNLSLSRSEIIRRVVSAWRAAPGVCPEKALEEARSLARLRYERDEWNFER